MIALLSFHPSYHDHQVPSRAPVKSCQCLSRCHCGQTVQIHCRLAESISGDSLIYKVQIRKNVGFDCKILSLMQTRCIYTAFNKVGAAGLIGEAKLDNLEYIMIPTIISRLNLLAVHWHRYSGDSPLTAFDSVSSSFLGDEDFIIPGDFNTAIQAAMDWAHSQPGPVAAQILHWAGAPSEISKQNIDAVESLARVRNNVAETFSKISALEQEAANDVRRWREAEAELMTIFTLEEGVPVAME